MRRNMARCRTRPARSALDWEVIKEAAGQKLRLIWTEAGGPPVVAPVQRGFGSRLIERSARDQLGGEATVDFLPRGVVYTVTCALEDVGQIRFKAAFWEAVLGVLERLVLSDAAWERMAPLIIGRPDQKGSTGRDNRMFVEGVLWIVRTGSPWRDLPEAFGDWNSVFRRFSRWSIKGVWWRIFEAMSDDPDFEYLIVNSTIVRAHQHAAGAKKGGLKIKRSAARAAA